ncbi:MAG: glycosyl hydrolase [Ruminococcaceae bacterium]|nr:glycosyl hydrolase [Oscillospiraceae bacterium]
MIVTLNDFIGEFEKVKAMGWIQTHRIGPTGIGKTLEDLLGIPENNLDEPDFGDYELKSCRIDSNSMLTMFTRAPEPRRANTYLRMKYGYSSNAYDNDEKVLHSTLSADRFTPVADTGHKLKISCAADGIYIECEDGVENIFWSREALRACFEKKYKNKFVYAKALSRGEGANEEFKFIEAYEVSGFDYDAFISLLEEGKIYVDLRIGQYHHGRNKGKTHDHGTGFRIKENDQHLLFKVKNKIG